MSQAAFNWQMFIAFWGLLAFCVLSFLVNCYLFWRSKKLFDQNKNILASLNKTSADMANMVAGVTIMGQRVLALESNTIAVFHQFERRLKEQGVSTLATQVTNAGAKAQTKAEASLLQPLPE
ncbi:MAG: cbb3-type cytochrome c oxidase subunit 3 [Candidatus Berkiella sp.]